MGPVEQAMMLHRRGRLADAMAIYRAVLAREPGRFEPNYLLAVACYQQDNASEAERLVSRALEIKPRSPEALALLAGALLALDRPAEALVACDKLLDLQPTNLEAACNRAVILTRLDRVDDAIAQYSEVLVRNPEIPAARYNRGTLLAGRGRHHDALADFDRVLASAPNRLDALKNRGNVLLKLNRPLEALASYERILAVQPHDVDALNNRGATLRSLKREAEALECYEKALALAPGHVGTLFNCGNLLLDIRRFDAAVALYDRALSIARDDDDVLRARGNACVQLGRYEEAEREFRRQLDRSPDSGAAWQGLANCLMETCNWEALGDARRQITAMVESGQQVEPLLFMRLVDDPALQLTCARQNAPTEPSSAAAPPARSGAGNGKIRIAYVSPDLRTHPVAFLIAELLELHDRNRFDLIGISYGPEEDSGIGARIAMAFDDFHRVRARSDAEIADLLRRLDVDIAVDLAGYTEYARPGIMARRPAPVQVGYLGYCGTTATPFLDYVIADAVAVPADQQPFFSEQIVHLPNSFMPCDSRQAVAAAEPHRGEHGLPNDAFVFCCFNRPYKFTAPVFDVWMRLLDRVRDSVLWLSANSEAARKNLRQHAERRGIDPARLVFASAVECREDHFARHRLADLFVDTTPYNAHATGCDALFSGLPVLTCLGNSFAGRVGASMLHAVGLAELVVADLQAYEVLALRLASDRDRLAAIRRRLQDSHAAHPLFDTNRTRRHLECAYSTMHAIARRGERARGFAVEPDPG